MHLQSAQFHWRKTLVFQLFYSTAHWAINNSLFPWHAWWWYYFRETFKERIKSLFALKSSIFSRKFEEHNMAGINYGMLLKLKTSISWTTNWNMAKCCDSLRKCRASTWFKTEWADVENENRFNVNNTHNIPWANVNIVCATTFSFKWIDTHTNTST